MISIINDLDTKSRAQFQVRLQSSIDLSDMNCMRGAPPGRVQVSFNSFTDSIILGFRRGPGGEIYFHLGHLE